MLRKKLLLTTDRRTEITYNEIVGSKLFPRKEQVLYKTLNIYGTEDDVRVKHKVRLKVTAVTKRIAKVEVMK